MTIFNIIEQCGDMLDLEYMNIVFDVTPTDEEQEDFFRLNPNVLRLFNLTKLCIRELCANYVPYYKEVTVKTENKRFDLSTLSNFIKIVSVKKGDDLVKVKTLNKEVVFSEDGEYVITYASYPEINYLSDKIEFPLEARCDVLAYGVCAYYTLSKGMFDEYNYYRDIYHSLACEIRELRNFIMPSRRWE
ncbi:MAG: hypothetical protein E7374_03680 [Clostridiales bacterium]|nr:hypothetical protein [Clostridiales bacterium]